MPEYTGHLNLYKPSRVDNIALDISLSENMQKIDDGVKTLNTTVETLKNNNSSKTEFAIQGAQELYLYELQQPYYSVNQGLCIDEANDELFTSQVLYGSEQGSYETFIIGRYTLSGVLKDSMILTNGGHGTSFGLEKTGGVTYIWSRMVEADANGNLLSESLCRMPYISNGKISISDSRVLKYSGYAPANTYQTPVTDFKNNLLGVWTTINEAMKITVYNINDVKNNNFSNPVYSYTFTSQLNSEVVQGVCIDGKYLYITTGQKATSFHLYRIDMTTGALVEDLQRAFGKDHTGNYVDDFGEPEGLYLYTDPNTGHKTLLTIIASGTGRRRARLYALSNNDGVKRFLGYAGDQSTQFNLVKANGESKTISSSISSLALVKEAGCYYMTTADTNRFTDHPSPGNSGWWLYVSGGATGSTSVIMPINQILVRNSTYHIHMFSRVVNDSGNGGTWGIVASSECNLMPTGLTKLSSWSMQGKWYMTTAISTSMTDLPTGEAAGGFWVENSCLDTTGGFRQTLTRNTTGAMSLYYRVISGTGTIGKWYKVTMTAI